MILEIVPAGEALTGTEVVVADAVTYGFGPDRLVLIVDAGDRPSGSGVDSAETVVLRGPFPEPVAGWLDSPVPVTGFVRLPEGCLRLGRLTRTYSGLGRHELTLSEPLPDDLLDRVRPVPPEALPGIGWLTALPQDPVRAMREFAATWYEDVPPVTTEVPAPATPLPAPLLAFYEVAAGRPELYGTQDEIRRPDEVEFAEDDESLVEFADENQGVWVGLIDPSQADPAVVIDDGYDEPAPDREPLSGFLLQFLLSEAAVAAPFTAVAGLLTGGISSAEAQRIVAPMTPVPLRPSPIPDSPTRFYVAPGLVAAVTEFSGGAVVLRVGSRRRSALRPLSDPGFDWDVFNG